MNKKYNISLLILSVLLCGNGTIFSQMVKLSCLKNKEKKAIICFDEHDDGTKASIKQQHIDEVNKFVDVLTQQNKDVTFFLELPNWTKNLQGRLMDNPINAPIKLALANNMRYKNISFDSFDNRADCDFWIRDMMQQRTQFVSAMNSGYKFPEYFHDITIKSFLEHVEKRQGQTRNQIVGLNSGNKIVDDSLQVLNKTSHDEVKKMVVECATACQCTLETHILNLISRLPQHLLKILYVKKMISESVYTDVTLLGLVLNAFKTGDFAVVHAGAYHSNNLQKLLMTFGFTLVDAPSMPAKDLEIDSLFAIKYPKSVPDVFVTKELEAFIGVDSGK